MQGGKEASTDFHLALMHHLDSNKRGLNYSTLNPSFFEALNINPLLDSQEFKTHLWHVFNKILEGTIEVFICCKSINIPSLPIGIRLDDDMKDQWIMVSTKVELKAHISIELLKNI
jgi:hypothetical protein